MKSIKLITLLIFASFAILGFSQDAQAGFSAPYEISDTTNGGDCIGIGSWDAATKTCVVQGDLDCGSLGADDICIQILSDDIVFNCKGNQIFENDSTPSGIGISIDGVSGVKIKRCHLDNFGQGIFVNDSPSIILFNNNFTAIDEQAMRFSNTDNSYIVGNEALNNDVEQMLLYTSTKNNYLVGNKFNSGGSVAGFSVSECINDSLIANSSNEVEPAGDGFNITNCTRSDFINNSASLNSGDGIQITGGSRSTVFANIAEDSVIRHGFLVSSTTSSYSFEHNIANDNGSSINFFGFIDNSSGNKTAGTANTYEGNTCDDNFGGGSFPDGICAGDNPPPP